jgi:hypothetical protein
MSNGAVSAAGQRTVPLAEVLAPDTFFQSAHSESGRALVLAFSQEFSAEVRQQLAAAAAPVRVEFRIVAHSWPQLQQVMDRVGDDRAMWEARGAQVSSWGPDWASNKVHIGLVKYEPVIALTIEQHYGADLVEVVTQDAPFVLPCDGE